MSGYRQYMTLWWQGQNGTTKEPSIHTLDNPAAVLGSAGGIVTASQAISVAGLVAVQLIPSLIYGDPPGSGPYSSCRDYLKLQFKCANGAVVDYHVPAPIVDVLTGAGLGRVDPSHPAIIALTDAMIAGAAHSSGSQIVSFLRGSRFRYDPRLAL